VAAAGNWVVIMVKKGSIFARIAGRWRSGSVRIDADDRAAELSGDAAVARVDRLEPAQAGDVRPARKLSEREEAMVAIGGHFQELSTLLRGVHSRMDGQLGRLCDTVAALQELPLLSAQQLEALRGLAVHMERQTQVGEHLGRSLQTLPALLQNVEQALQRAAQTDERTATTMREFQGTMDRIHASMSAMVRHGEQQAKATQQLADQRSDAVQSLATGMERVQRDALRELRDAADVSLQSLRRTHEDQSNRLQRVVQEHAGWNKAVLVVVGIAVFGILGLLVMQLVQ
jgi:DNA-binding ferritin-like protein